MPGLRIERAAAPVRAAPHARPHDRSLHRRRRVQRTHPVLLHLRLRRRLQLRRQIERVVERDALSANGGGLVGNGCVGDVSSPGTSLGGTGRSSIGQTGFAGDAIEHEHEALLRQLDDGVDPSCRPTVSVTRFGGDGRVVVPQAVMHDLEMPLALAGRRVEADERFAEQVLARPAAAVLVVARRLDRQVEQPARARRASSAPRRSCGRCTSTIRRSHVSLPNSPGCGMVWKPRPLAGARVERPDVARRIVAVHQPVADAVAEDDEVLVDDRRRRVRVVLLVDRPRPGLRRDRRCRALPNDSIGWPVFASRQIKR